MARGMRGRLRSWVLLAARRDSRRARPAPSRSRATTCPRRSRPGWIGCCAGTRTRAVRSCTARATAAPASGRRASSSTSPNRRGASPRSGSSSTRSTVPLPGAAKRWPQEVRADGKPVPVVSVGGRPSARLPAGRHTLTGIFRWDALPELLQIPPETGIVRLRLRGARRPVRQPGRARPALAPEARRAGRRPGGAAARGDRAPARRRRDPAAPRDAGAARGRGPQPRGRPRPRASRRLRAALAHEPAPRPPRPGRPPARAGAPRQLAPRARRASRGARRRARAAPIPAARGTTPRCGSSTRARSCGSSTVEDGVPVDPAQTTLPDDWKHLPAYLMEPGRTLRFVEKRRGDSDPAPDQLTLSRALWLDFDGGGYTLTDTIDGVVRRSTRLEMTPGTELGRVEIGGRDQLITRLDDVAARGRRGAAGAHPARRRQPRRVERRRPLRARRSPPSAGTTTSRGSRGDSICRPAGGSSTRRASTAPRPTWLNRWTLLDLFAVLVLTLVFFRLWARRWGALALVGLALTWTEPGAPHWAWAAALAGEALRRVLPVGRFPRFTRVVALYRGVALAVLVLVSIPFAVDQVRAGLSPALERPRAARVSSPRSVDAGAARSSGPRAPWKRRRHRARAELGRRRCCATSSSKRPPCVAAEGAASGYSPRAARPPLLRARPEGAHHDRAGAPRLAVDERGAPLERPGRARSDAAPAADPAVRERRARLRARGAAGGAAALRDRRLGAGRQPLPAPGRRGGRGAVLAAVLAAPGPARADIPSQELLDELRARLLENPECHPHCAASPRLALERAAEGAARAHRGPRAGGDRGAASRRRAELGAGAGADRRRARRGAPAQRRRGALGAAAAGPTPDRGGGRASRPRLDRAPAAPAPAPGRGARRGLDRARRARGRPRRGEPPARSHPRGRETTATGPSSRASCRPSCAWSARSASASSGRSRRASSASRPPRPRSSSSFRCCRASR